MNGSEPRLLHYRVASWLAAKVLFSRLPRYVFRGHAHVDWPLATSLERVATRLHAFERIPEIEASILREFQRRAHHYLTDVPDSRESVEWLALIQHYGGPTRLLDFTHSPYVAAFFAMENADGDAAVWAVDMDALYGSARMRYRTDITRGNLRTNDQLLELANRVVTLGSEVPGVVLVEPLRLNQRISTQQGTFMMPLIVTQSFNANFRDGLGVSSDVFDGKEAVRYSGDSPYETLDRAVLLKIVLPREQHSEAMLDLAAMNVTSTSLFGGLEGFARSLPGILRGSDQQHYQSLRIRELFDRDKD